MSDPRAKSAFRVVRELGKRSESTFAALRGTQEIVVLQRFLRSTATDAIQREAQCLAKNWHPNVVRVRSVEMEGNELVVATDFVDGVTLAELLALAAADPRHGLVKPQILARVVLDVLAGLQGIVGLRDESTALLHAFHGAVCPSNVVVGKDGVARLVAVFRPQPVHARDASEALATRRPRRSRSAGRRRDGAISTRAA